MDVVREVFSPLRMNASGTISGNALGGFFCTTAGTVQIQVSSGGADIVSQFSVAAGTYYPLPFAIPGSCYVTLGGGAVGTFGVA